MGAKRGFLGHYYRVQTLYYAFELKRTAFLFNRDNSKRVKTELFMARMKEAEVDVNSSLAQYLEVKHALEVRMRQKLSIPIGIDCEIIKPEKKQFTYGRKLSPFKFSYGGHLMELFEICKAIDENRGFDYAREQVKKSLENDKQ